ncbi:MAG: Hsp70 family protein [Candidatus Solibacter usitatus]|nr:Hsp70 family protein [Candidatus Solibacter usitatus]
MLEVQMKIGVDFGTTRIVVAQVDRGNYPVVSFATPDGGSEEWYPPLIAIKEGERRFGWEAYALQDDAEWTVLRSVKRLLNDAGPNTLIDTGGAHIPLLHLLRALVEDLRGNVVRNSSLPLKEGDVLEAMLGVPAHANSNQRFLTAEAFRLAGFSVLGVLNEPSAASIEFGHRNKEGLTEKQKLLVYDLGGGTFDVSLVEHDERTHTVSASDGISTLGGDDFDLLLAELASEAAGIDLDHLNQGEMFRLLEECRRRKESLHPNTRKVSIDLDAVRAGLPEVAVPVADFFERGRPLVEETMHAVRDLLDRHGDPEIHCLYVTGGGSELPLVSRMLREEFGRRVKRSAYTRAATAIGLAIQADASAGYQLRDRFTRYFGVWREADAGSRVVFDPLFPKNTALPSTGEPALEIRRAYQPVHNVGHFRYLECTHLGEDGQPSGDITVWDEILFPLDPALQAIEDLRAVDVGISEAATRQAVEELYQCDAAGGVSVTIRTAGHERVYRLGRWAVKTAPVSAARKRRATTSKIR